MTKNNVVIISKNGLLGQVRTTTFYTNNKKFVEVKFKNYLKSANKFKNPHHSPLKWL